MKRIVLVFLLMGVGLVWADTLDFSRWTVVVTTTQSEAAVLPSSKELSKRCLEVIRRADYDSDVTVAGFLAVNPKQARRLERMTLEYRRGDTRYHSDGAVLVDYEFPVTGMVLEQLLPETGGGRLLGRIACPCCGQEWPENKEIPADVTPVPYETGGEPVHTGILVDARGLELRPALFPRIVNGLGDEVYGPGFVDEDTLAEAGMVGYYRTQSDALFSERIGSDPLVVRALKVTGANQCDLVVSDYDAARIHGTLANLELLAGCRVGLLKD